MAAIKLNRLEVQSAVWKKLAGFLADEVKALREQNDSLTLTQDQTTVKRAQIAFAKRILALADEAGQEARQSGAEGFESAFLPPHGG